MAKLTDAELKALGIHKWSPEEIEADRNALAYFRTVVSKYAEGQVTGKEHKAALLQAWKGDVAITFPEDVEAYLAGQPIATRCSLEITFIETVRNINF